ncbi:hypothetical protein QP446_09980 [Corynebacterium riegelii]|uniref:hypothetical protein n=1 Tax=Corynebacterium riegelii TaxID=156976 RepID=UPI00254B77A7|nr:hypothetical protein [Corynebacterium riegelii]MDK7181082.1 hypothetical protein [Corynebacterium riegelii]
MTRVTARNLQRSFGKKVVLGGVDFDLGPGVHGLLGRNGVGKIHSVERDCWAVEVGWG